MARGPGLEWRLRLRQHHLADVARLGHEAHGVLERRHLELMHRQRFEVAALEAVHHGAQQPRDQRRALGARTINPATEDLTARIKALHGAEMHFGRERASTDAYIDGAGAPSILSDVVHMAKQHARHVITAAYLKPIELPAGAMLTSEMTITTAVGYPDKFPAVIAAMPRLRDKIAAMISHSLPFDEILDGLKIAATPASAKVMIRFGGPAA